MGMMTDRITLDNRQATAKFCREAAILQEMAKTPTRVSVGWTKLKSAPDVSRQFCDPTKVLRHENLD